MNRQIFMAAAIITVVFGMVGSGIGTGILFANAQPQIRDVDCGSYDITICSDCGSYNPTLCNIWR